MSAYNPFGKPLRELDTGDLNALRGVSEGWYVEYKSEVPDALSIAKSISAFANTYGGWLFYGIDETPGSENMAGRFIGISDEKLDRFLKRIQQAIADSLNPSPHYELKVLSGPNDELGLSDAHSIICISVPRGHATPYVHRSGRIYRRVGDGSEPKPENDRFVLDQLWQRGKQIREEYSEWLGKDLEFSKDEETQPYLRVFLVPDLWRDKDIWVETTTSRVREIMTSTHEVEDTWCSSPFDNVHRTVSGFVCRQLIDNNPFNLTATWFLRQNLTSEIVFPLPFINDAEIWSVEAELDGYQYAKDYAEILRRTGHQTARIVDLNFVFSSLIGIMHIQSLLDKEAGHCGPTFMKAEFLNIWRVCPFVDVESVIRYQQEHGVPMCMSDRFFALPTKDPESFIELPELPEIEGIAARKYGRAMIGFEPISHAFGIETGVELAAKGNNDSSLIHFELLESAKRAMVAQERRNARIRKQQ